MKSKSTNIGPTDKRLLFRVTVGHSFPTGISKYDTCNTMCGHSNVTACQVQGEQLAILLQKCTMC